MESNIEAYDSNKTLFALDVKPYLENFNEQLKKRYTDTEKAEQYKVYQLDELDSIENDPTLTESDKKLIVRLKEIKEPSHRAQQLLGGIENFFNSTIDEAKSESPLTASEPRAKLRRTAAILYKNAQIPEMNISRGSFKEVSGPLGLDQKFIRPTTQLIIENIGPVWCWDGNIPDLVGKTIAARADIQLAYVANNPESKTPQEEVSKQILKEIEDIKILNKRLGEPRYLPRVYQKTKHGQYVENIPLDFPNGETKTRLNDIVQVADGLVDMWKSIGLVLTDIKGMNLRKRNNGDVVITDTGGKIGIGGGSPEFDSRYLVRINKEGIYTYSIEHTPAYAPPEHTRQLSGADTEMIKTEPFLVYQLGILLCQSLFEKYKIDDSLDSNRGYIWTDLSRESDPICTINSDTVIYLLQKYPVKDIPVSITNILISMLSNDPDSRPSIEEVRNTLQQATSTMSN